MYCPKKCSDIHIKLHIFSNTPYSEPDQDVSPNNDTDWDWGFKENLLRKKLLFVDYPFYAFYAFYAFYELLRLETEKKLFVSQEELV